jgi:hypothetical protein
MARWNAKLVSSAEKKIRLKAWLDECKDFRSTQADEWRAYCREHRKRMRLDRNAQYVEQDIEKTTFYDFIQAKFVKDFDVVAEDDFLFVNKAFAIVKGLRYSQDTAAIFDEMHEEDEHLLATSAFLEVLHVFC